jgi:predicted acyltransferase
MDSPARPAPERALSLDAYRGFVMLLMAGEVLRFHAMAENFPANGFWNFLSHHQEHAPWRGCTLHDLIQPSFSFLVGCALPWSIANRQARGQGPTGMWIHTIWRALALIFLGVFLRSTHSKFTNFTFEDTLSQIGLGYLFLWALAWKSWRIQLASLLLILLGYWAWFAFSPLPPADFDAASVGAKPNWPHLMDGFAAHWNLNTHPAHHFDLWFLNLFPRQKPWLFNGGGYVTLSFIPTLATMILGLLAGQWLRRKDLPHLTRIGTLVIAGLASLGFGTLLDLTGICPSVKRIWTPAWVLVSGGWCALLLAGFHFIADVRQWHRPMLPLVVVGMNSIFTYVIAHLWEGFFKANTTNHLNTLLLAWRGPAIFDPGENAWKILFGLHAPVAEGFVVLALIWLCCFWLWRRRIFLRI